MNEDAMNSARYKNLSTLMSPCYGDGIESSARRDAGQQRVDLQFQLADALLVIGLVVKGAAEIIAHVIHVLADRLEHDPDVTIRDADEVPVGPVFFGCQARLL